MLSRQQQHHAALSGDIHTLRHMPLPVRKVYEI